jgi:hypothetical protein
MVVDQCSWRDQSLEAGGSRSPREVDILAVHEEVFIKSAYSLEERTRDQKNTPGAPGGL